MIVTVAFRLLLLETVSVGHTSGCEDIRSEWNEIDRSRYIVILVEEVLQILVFVVNEVLAPLHLLVTVSLKSGSFGRSRIDVLEQALDSQVGLIPCGRRLG